MVTGFKGKYEHTLDEKGRVSLPAKLRKSLAAGAADAFVITRGFENCLDLYPKEAWSKLEDELRGRLNMYNTEDRLFLRTILMWAHEVTLDKQARIMIPQELLDVAGITSGVTIIGALEKIEIWSTEEFQRYRDRYAEQSYEDVAARVMGGG
jgi:MraZ protein